MIEAESELTARRFETDRPVAASDRWQVFGVGSPHGDDQAGWRLARHVAEILEVEEGPRILRTPSELLLLEGLPDSILICDGCQGGLPAGTLRLFVWPDAQILTERLSGSHDVGLPFVLSLLQRIGRLPTRVWVCTVEIASALPGEAISPEVLVGLAPERVRQLLHCRLPCGTLPGHLAPDSAAG